MSKSAREKRKHIRPEIVFNKYDEQVGECICCRALFEVRSS